MKLIQQELL